MEPRVDVLHCLLVREARTDESWSNATGPTALALRGLSYSFRVNPDVEFPMDAKPPWAVYIRATGRDAGPTRMLFRVHHRDPRRKWNEISRFPIRKTIPFSMGETETHELAVQLPYLRFGGVGLHAISVHFRVEDEEEREIEEARGSPLGDRSRGTFRSVGLVIRRCRLLLGGEAVMSWKTHHLQPATPGSSRASLDIAAADDRFPSAVAGDAFTMESPPMQFEVHSEDEYFASPPRAGTLLDADAEFERKAKLSLFLLLRTARKRLRNEPQPSNPRAAFFQRATFNDRSACGSTRESRLPTSKNSVAALLAATVDTTQGLLPLVEQNIEDHSEVKRHYDSLLAMLDEFLPTIAPN